MLRHFARWDKLFVQFLKRDWKKILVWILGVGLFSAGFVPAFAEIGKGQGFRGLYETMQTPAMIAIVGPTPVDRAEDYTLGAMYAHEMLLFCGLLAMILSALHVIGHTRREEDLGLMELVRSFQVGRQANSLAVMAETVLINVLLALVTGGILAGYGESSLSAEGSLLFGASIGMSGIMGAAVALVVAQIMPVSSAATGASLGIVGALFLVRAGTDLSNESLSMLNPLGWTYLTYPFAENRWGPLGLAAVFTALAVAAAFALEGRRDLGAGYLPERKGRVAARKTLLSVHGLFLRLNRGVILAWTIAYLAIGASYGSIYGDMQTFVESNDLIRQMFTASGVSIEASFTGIILLVSTSLVAILPVAVVNRLFSEEVRLRLSQLLATQVSRARLYWTNVLLAVLAGLAGTAAAAVGLGATAVAAMGDGASMDFGDFLTAGFNFFPSVLFFAALAALALGWNPRLGKAVYLYLAYSFALNYFDGLADFPEWLSNTAVQSWIPRMPAEPFDGTVFAAVTVISAALMVAGYLGYRRRDMAEGA